MIDGNFNGRRAAIAPVFAAAVVVVGGRVVVRAVAAQPAVVGEFGCGVQVTACSGRCQLGCSLASSRGKK